MISFRGTSTSGQPCDSAHFPSLLFAPFYQGEGMVGGKILSSSCFGGKADTRLIVSEVGSPRKPLHCSLILFRAPLEPWCVSAPGEKVMLWLTEKHVSENCLISSKLMRQKEMECHPVDASPLNATRERRKRAKKQSKLLWLPNHSSFRI